MTARERLRQFLHGEPVDRRLFLPMVASLLATVIGRGVRETLSDSALLFSAVRDAQRLLGNDAHFLLPDRTLLAEALGAQVVWPSADGSPHLAGRPWANAVPTQLPANFIDSTRLGVVVSTFRRLRAADPHIALGLAISGPVELSQLLCGAERIVDAGPRQLSDVLELADEACLAVLRCCGEIGLDLLVLLDDGLPELAAADNSFATQVWTPLKNLAAFYDAPVVVVSRGLDSRTLSALCALRPDAFVTDVWDTQLGWDTPPRIGVGVAVDDLRRPDRLEMLRSLPAQDPHWFVSTAEPLGAELPLADAIGLARVVAHLRA